MLIGKNEIGPDVMEMVDSGVKAGLGTQAEMLLQFLNLQRLMAERLANGKSVDLGFVILHSTYYRHNWKERLLNKMGATKTRAWSLQDANKLVNPELYDAIMLSPSERLLLIKMDLFAMHHKAGYLYRRIEVEHKPHWWDMVDAVESARLKELGPFRYAKYVASVVVDSIDTSIRLLQKWTTAVTRWTHVSVERTDKGFYRLLPARTQTWAVRTLRLLPLRPDQLGVVQGTAGDPACLSFEAIGVPKMSDDEPPVEDVRNDRGHLPEPENREA